MELTSGRHRRDRGFRSGFLIVAAMANDKRGRKGVPMALGLCYGSLRDVGAVDLVRIAGENGFTGIMLPPFPRASAVEAAGFRAILRAHGIRRVVLDGVMAALPRCDFPVERGWTVDQHFQIANRFGVDCFNVPHYGGDPDTPVAEFVDALGPFAERAARSGISVALEFLPGTGIPDLARAREIVEQVGARNLGICLDTWHWARSRASVADVRALPKGMVKDFQVSDRAADEYLRPDSEQWGRLVPGEGVLPLVELVLAVRANAPELTANAEVFSHLLQGMEPADAARLVSRGLGRVLDVAR